MNTVKITPKLRCISTFQILKSLPPTPALFHRGGCIQLKPNRRQGISAMDKRYTCSNQAKKPLITYMSSMESDAALH